MISRRRFLHISLAGLAGGLAAACAQAGSQSPTAPTATMPLPPSTPTRTAVTSTPTPRAVTPEVILHNENRPGFYVRYFKPFPAPDPARWRLTIGGLVDAPATLSLEQILRDLPLKEQNTRMKCVEGWSSRAMWGGFTYAALAALVKPQPTATHVRFDCADGYWEVLPISELTREGALFVTHMNGSLLSAEYGAPLRMILPWLYGYKGAKAVTGLEFRAKGEPGYWSTVGPYSVDGNILPGLDYPLDLDGKPREVDGGEVTEY